MALEGSALLVGVEEQGERAGGLGADLAGVGDEDFVEEGLVEQAADGVGGLLVDGVAVAGEVEAVGELGLGLGVVGGGRVEAAGQGVEERADAVLFGFELVEGHGAGVVGVEEGVALVEEVVALAGEVLGLEFGLGVEDGELLGDDRFERLAGGGVDLLVGVVGDDEVLDLFDVHGPALAGGAALVAAGADEVGVDHAVAVLGVGEDQPGLAVGAVERAFEVVVVVLGLVAGEVVRSEHGLDLGPHVHRHERLVGAGVVDAVVDDGAFVVGVLETAVQGGQPDRLGGAFRGGQGGEAPFGQLVQEAA